MTTKLHEVLAVEGDKEGLARKVMQEAKSTFSSKPNLFTGNIKHTEMFDANAPILADEHMALETTVSEKLDYIAKTIASYYCVTFSKDAANQKAVADVVVDGDVLIKDAPVTWLLGMESKLKTFRSILETIPTLSSAIHWEIDEVHEKVGVFRTKFPIERFKTSKVIKSKVLYDATEHHPAQIEHWNEMENVGKITDIMWSGMLPASRKSELLQKNDKLIQAFKKSRQRANGHVVETSDAGEIIFNYLLD